MKRRPVRRLWMGLLATALAWAALAPAHATHPGTAGRLALLISDLAAGTDEIYTVDPDGSELVPITASGFRKALPRWSSSGLVAYARADESPRVLVVDPATGSARVVLELSAPSSVLGITWSPDGNELAVAVEHKAGLVDLSVVSVDGTHLRHVVSYPAGGPIDWSPHGDRLAVTTSNDAETVIALLALDGSAPVPLTRGSDPSWSPDGSRLVYVGAGGTSIIDASGGIPTVIPGLEIHDPPGAGLSVGYYPAWSPEGDEIAVIAFQGAGADVVDPVTGERRPVLSGTWPRFVYDVSWEPLAPPSGFFDVSTGHTFEADIAWLRAAGITRGCNPPANTHYCPDRTLTRAEAATLLARALQLPTPPTDGTRFTDDDTSIHERAIEAIAAAGITRGCNPPTNTHYCPDRTLTRAQAAALLHRALD